MQGTRTDRSDRGSSITTDPVTRLRQWGHVDEQRIYGLPAPPTDVIIGSAADCELRLLDEEEQVSRKHAKLQPYGDGWKLHDLGSKNGLWRNGYRRLSWALTPGDEIGIGGLKLIAEGRQMIALRALLCRCLGWRADRQLAVDNALRSLCEWAAGRCAVMLLGDGNLTTVAQRLHASSVGATPFIALEECDRVTQGTLWVPELPSDLSPLLAHQERGSRIVLQAHRPEDVTRVTRAFTRLSIIELPSLLSRHYELGRILEEVCSDVAVDLAAPTIGYMENDIKQLSRRSYRGFSDLEEAAHKLVALRAWGVVRGAAELGIHYSVLSKWAERWLSDGEP